MKTIEDISSKYKKQKDRKIAEKSLQLGGECTRIVSEDFETIEKLLEDDNKKQ